jgi:outer membrane protein assembly factor BamA
MKKQLFFLSLGLCTAVRPVLEGEPDTSSSLIIRSVRIDGNDLTQPQVILREMKLHVGDTLSEATLTKDRDRIYSLGLFNKVAVTHADTASSTDLLVSVVERWYIWPFPVLGAKFRDVNKLYYGLGVTHQNFRGRDERLSTSFSTGYEKSASLTYQNPRLTDDDDIFLRTSLLYQDSHNLGETNIEFEQIKRTASLSLGKRFGLFQTLIGTVGYELWEVPDTSQGRTVSPDGTDRFWQAGLHYTYDARNVREYPTDGFYFDATAANDGFGSESTIRTFTYAEDVRWYTMLNDDWTLAWHQFSSFTAGGIVPVYHLLILGARLGVRGYTRDHFVGEDFVGGSAEVRVPLLSPRYVTLNFLNIHQFNTLRYGLYAAVFADVGKVWFRSDTYDNVPWLASAGVGLHFLLPYSAVLRTEFSVNARGDTQVALSTGVPF